ncbi:hypothetical protein [Streptomyces chattanoogensis]|uniref:hypothetical protein n=1 Tax=Streptomyces chattanoogensis TaxID=66876 RepID=UPI0036B1EC1F
MATSAGVTPGAAMGEDRVTEFLEQVITDGGAAAAGLCTSLGDRLGLYTAMAGAGPLTSAQLAVRTGLVERYVREWLAAQVAGGYVAYAPGADAYELPDEHAEVLADPDSPHYAAGFFTMLQALYATEDALVDAFRTGEGVGPRALRNHAGEEAMRTIAADAGLRHRKPVAQRPVHRVHAVGR